MVEVTLELTNEELEEMLSKELKKVGKFDTDDEALYNQYFHNLIEEGHGTLFYGPVRLRDWVLETLSRLTVIEPWNDEYEEVKQLWESREYENNKYVVVSYLNNKYLIEEY